MENSKKAEIMVVECKFVACPHCGCELGDWLDDPRNEPDQICDDCELPFRIPQNIQLIWE